MLLIELPAYCAGDAPMREALANSPHGQWAGEPPLVSTHPPPRGAGGAPNKGKTAVLLALRFLQGGRPAAGDAAAVLSHVPLETGLLALDVI